MASVLPNSPTVFWPVCRLKQHRHHRYTPGVIGTTSAPGRVDDRGSTPLFLHRRSGFQHKLPRRWRKNSSTAASGLQLAVLVSGPRRLLAFAPEPARDRHAIARPSVVYLPNDPLQTWPGHLLTAIFHKATLIFRLAAVGSDRPLFADYGEASCSAVRLGGSH